METNISDTPITDAAYFSRGSTMYSMAGEMKKLERQNAQLRSELLACYNVLPGIVQLEKLPDLILSGTVSDTVHAFTLMQAKHMSLLRQAELAIAFANRERNVIRMLGDDYTEVLQLIRAALKEIPHA